MNTNLIMGLLIQLVAALKEPAPPVSGSYSNFYNVPSITNIVWGGIDLSHREKLGTNAGLPFIAGPTNYVFRFTDEAIRELAKSGRICEVLGHRWEGGRVGEGPFNTFADFHPGVTFRHCSICGADQSKTEGDWK